MDRVAFLHDQAAMARSDGLDRTGKFLDETADEMESLQATVAKLPKDAEGNPMIEGTAYYHFNGYGIAEYVFLWDDYLCGESEYWHTTREAAEAARKGAE